MHITIFKIKEKYNNISIKAYKGIYKGVSDIDGGKRARPRSVPFIPLYSLMYKYTIVCINIQVVYISIVIWQYIRIYMAKTIDNAARPWYYKDNKNKGASPQGVKNGKNNFVQKSRQRPDNKG